MRTLARVGMMLPSNGFARRYFQHRKNYLPMCSNATPPEIKEKPWWDDQSGHINIQPWNGEMVCYRNIRIRNQSRIIDCIVNS